MALLGNQITISGTAQRLTSGSEQVETLLLKAHASNSGDVYVGPSTVTTSNGYPISPGEEFTIGPAHGGLKRTEQPSEVYAIGTTSDKLSWVGTRK